MCSFDLLLALRNVSAYLESNGERESYCNSKERALQQMAYLLGDGNGDGNLFDGVDIRNMIVGNAVEVDDTLFSVAHTKLHGQLAGEKHGNAATQYNCILVYYSGVPAFVVPIHHNAFMQASSPFACIEEELLRSGLSRAPTVGRALIEVMTAFGGVVW